MKAIPAAACLAVLTVAVWWLVHPDPWNDATAWVLVMGGVWIVFGLGVWFLRRAPLKAVVVLTLLGAVALPLAAGFAPPRSSDDLYRYLWDGRVQTSGIDPYRYVPAAPELTHLRDDFLWPQQSAWCEPDVPGRVTAGCSLINRPAVHTIYPPAAQGYFAAVDLLSPNGFRERPIQLASVLFVVATTVLLLLVKPRLAALWAWCPLVALEAGNNAHLDVVAAFLTVAALVVAARAKTWRGTVSGAVLLGLAIATKFTPALAGPSLVRRRPLTLIATTAVTVALLYLPHLLAVGPKVLGFLPEYLRAEGYGSGTRFSLLALALPPAVAAVVAALILLATTAWVLVKADPDRPWDTAVMLTGVFLLVSTPGYAWYAMLLAALVALSGRAEWLTVCVAGYVAQYAANLQLPATAARQLGYGLAALTVLTVILVRTVRPGHASPRFSAGRFARLRPSAGPAAGAAVPPHQRHADFPHRKVWISTGALLGRNAIHRAFRRRR